MSQQQDLSAQINHDFSEVTDLLVALGDKKRLEILSKLITAYHQDPLCVKDLTELTNISRPAVSHHLKILKEAGIINYTKKGTKSYYYIDNVQTNIAKMQQLTDDLLKITC